MRPLSCKWRLIQKTTWYMFFFLDVFSIFISHFLKKLINWNFELPNDISVRLVSIFCTKSNRLAFNASTYPFFTLFIEIYSALFIEVTLGEGRQRITEACTKENVFALIFLYPNSFFFHIINLLVWMHSVTEFFCFQYINQTGFRVCLKELYETKYDPLSVTYTVLSGKKTLGNECL